MVSRQIAAPAFTEIAHHTINRPAADLLILHFTRGGVGGFHQNKNARILLPANFQQRQDSIAAKISVNRQRISAKRCKWMAIYRNLSKMRGGIGFHRGADIITLSIRNDKQALFFGIANRFS